LVVACAYATMCNKTLTLYRKIRELKISPNLWSKLFYTDFKPLNLRLLGLTVSHGGNNYGNYGISKCEQLIHTERCLKNLQRDGSGPPNYRHYADDTTRHKVRALVSFSLRKSHFPVDTATGGLRVGYLRKCKDSRGRNFQLWGSHNSTVIFPGLFHSHRQYRFLVFIRCIIFYLELDCSSLELLRPGGLERI